MSRTIPAGLVAPLAAGVTRLPRCLRLDLRDGTSFGITTHDLDLTVDLGDGPLAYSASTGALPSNVSLAIGLEADNFEVAGPIGALVTRVGVLGGRFHQARARLFQADVSDPTQLIRILAGKVAQPRVEGGRFVFEVRSAADAYNQTIGRVTSPQCDNDYGVFDPPRSYCQATPLVWTAEVVAVADDMTFQVAWTGSPAPIAAENVRAGLVAFDTGELAGTLPVEVFDFDFDAGVITTFQPLAQAPEIGDELTVTEGCDKTIATCKRLGQILNMRAFPHMKGADDTYKYPVPGTNA